MSIAIQSRFMSRPGAGYWALALGLLMAAAVALLSPPGLLNYPVDPNAPFDSAELEAATFVLNPATAEPVQPVDNDKQAAPLFGMDTIPLVGGDVLEKWSRARAQIAQDLDAVARCRVNEPCSPAAQKLIDLSSKGAGRSGRAKVGLINRAVDLAIGPTSDEAQWGVPDHWSAPFETIRSGRGDCEDYAIVKYAALLEAGIPSEDMKIVILKNAFPNEDHAVLAAFVDGEWLILDNRTLTLVRDVDMTRAVPQLVLDQEGVRRFVSRSRRNQATS